MVQTHRTTPAGRAPMGAFLLIASIVAAAPAAGAKPAAGFVKLTDGDSCYVRVFSQTRGRLGLLVEARRNPETDSIGALVRGVTPDGPAEEAGIREGDIVTRFNDERLARARAEAGEEGSPPGRRLIELARRLEPGDTVRLEYRRGREAHTATLVAERLDRFAFGFGPPLPDDLGMGHLRGELERLRDLPRRIGFALPRSRLGLELVALNPGLGAYFGTAEGVLVVNIEQGSPLGLQAGDVILSIDGRAPSGPAHALRILRSYEPDEAITFEILRQNKRMKVQGKAPQRPARPSR